MAKRSRYQRQVISNYYENRAAIALQRVQELVTELYLSQGKRRQQQWNHVARHLEALGVKRSHIDHLVAQDDPQLVAKFVRRLMERR